MRTEFNSRFKIRTYLFLFYFMGLLLISIFIFVFINTFQILLGDKADAIPGLVVSSLFLYTFARVFVKELDKKNISRLSFEKEHLAITYYHRLRLKKAHIPINDKSYSFYKRKYIRKDLYYLRFEVGDKKTLTISAPTAFWTQNDLENIQNQLQRVS